MSIMNTSCNYSGKYQNTERAQNGDSSCDLIVFGYSSKLFRDDERAKEVDEGKHLIFWMGDEHLKIDRYDVRGYLHDLSNFEVGTYECILTEEDKNEEELCDNERYRSLLKVNEDQDVYNEEEFKRSLNSKKKYSQVSYQYSDTHCESNKHCNIQQERIDCGKVFQLSPHLSIPPNIHLPATDKMNQIIEKTANHVVQHGRQMEIIIKTRQRNNENFKFLYPEHELNPYYEHILGLIKAGSYKIGSSESNKDMTEMQLHHNISASYQVDSAPFVAHVDQKVSDNCPYSSLVSKIKNSKSSSLDN